MEEYKIEDLIEIFSDHMVRAKKQKDDFIKKFKQDCPNDPIPEVYEKDFNFPCALKSICSEILRLKKEEEGDGKKSEWISVKDRLPEIGLPVLVIDRYGSVKTNGSVRQITRNAKSTYLWQNKSKISYEFAPEPRYSHWMPLPKMPRT